MNCLGLSGVVLLASVCGASAAATAVAPATGRPTIDSEMRRGELSAFECSLRAPAEFPQCVFYAVAAEQQKQANIEVFKLGAFYGACEDANAILKADQATAAKDNSAAADVLQDRANRANFYRLFRQQQLKLGLSNEQVVASEPYKTPVAKKEMLAMLKDWAGNPPH